MKVNYIIQVPDPKETSASQMKISNDLSSIVNDRIKSSKYASAYDGEIYLYLFIKEQRSSNRVKQLQDGIFVGFCDKILSSDEGSVFATIMRNAINRNLSIPKSEYNCLIYFSIDKLDVESFFICNEKSAIAYKAIDPEYTLDEVIMTPKERSAVMRAISLIRDNKLIYQNWNLSKIDKRVKSILCFHGVPGTGKSMCAHGVAAYLGKKLLLGSYAQIESEFVGVGAKNLVSLFKAAQEQDAVLFIDEADTFLSKRLPTSNDSSKHYNSMSNELYTLIENYNGCIIFASNHIKDFDPAVISRIIEPIEFNLPDLNGRKAILNQMLQEEFPVKNIKSEDSLEILASATDGFSGRDLRKVMQITLASIVWKYKYELNIPEQEIEATIDDFLNCIKEVKESKDKIQGKANNRTGNLLANFEEIERKNNRLIQLAALSLLADGVIKSSESDMFKQLEKKYRVTCPLDKELIPSVAKICSGVEDNNEKAELIETVCRMSAIDGEIHDSEITLLKEVCDNLDVKDSVFESIKSYALRLADDYSNWQTIVSAIGCSDSTILSKLKEEFSEAASYSRLAQYYRDGSPLFGGIEPNEKKAEKYELMAKQLGYKK